MTFNDLRRMVCVGERVDESALESYIRTNLADAADLALVEEHKWSFVDVVYDRINIPLTDAAEALALRGQIISMFTKWNIKLNYPLFS